METIIQKHLTSLRLREPQVYKNIIVFPLDTPANGSPTYITLEDALMSNTLKVTEITQDGSVPDLLVVNQGNEPVLLLDGEELVGAKQNRVLNTTILLREKSETKIPVSCTERGRWAYSSPQFASTDVIMEQKLRAQKSQSVSHSLEDGLCFHSDQGLVWEGISALHAKAKTQSPTGAMNDVFKAREGDFKECLQTFTLSPGQRGLLVVINGEVTGFDMISLTGPYVKLHEKLVRSYVLDGLISPDPKEIAIEEAKARAQGFLGELARAREARFESIGYGWDFRYQAVGLAGNALVHADHVIHAAFFKLDTEADQVNMATLRQRRRHRYSD